MSANRGEWNVRYWGGEYARHAPRRRFPPRHMAGVSKLYGVSEFNLDGRTIQHQNIVMRLSLRAPQQSYA